MRRARLLRIEDTRRDEPAFLDSLLNGADVRGRAEAALTAGRLGDRRHAPRLRTLAADADTAVAADALFALGLLQDSAAVPAATTGLHAPPPVGVEAAWLLGQLGDVARSAIVAGLGNADLDPRTRGALLLAAARLRPVPADAVVPWVASADTALAWRAAYALARGRSAAGVRPLLAVAGAPASSTREQVARGLTHPVAGDSLGTDARAALARLAADPEGRVRVNAVRALASYGRVAAARVVGALGDADAGVRVAAAQSLDLVLDSTAAAWSAAFSADTAFVAQQAVADGAAKRGLILDGTRGWRSSAEWQRRAAAVQLDARGPAATAVERSAAWMRDPDGRVRAASAAALALLADSAAVRAPARVALRRALDDTDVGVRAAALGALASGATEGDLSAALGAYGRSAADPDNDARLAFWQLADSALGHGPVSDSVARRLDALVRPGDPLERLAASRIPRFAAWRDSTSVARPWEWYVARAAEAARPGAVVARIETERGVIELELLARDAPLTVFNFVALARRGYFDGQRFHRVVPNFVVQGGDPRGDGNGGPGYAIRDELNRHRYLRGTLGMALSGPNTGGSQFFVTHSPQSHLDGGYTVFGQLVAGGDVLDHIVQGDRIVRVRLR